MQDRGNADSARHCSDADVSVFGSRRRFDGEDAASSADGLIYGVPQAEAVQSLDPHVIAAIARLRDADPNSLAQLEAALTTKAGVYAEPHLLNSVSGVTAEEIAAPDLGGTLAETTNNPVWDICAGDSLYQVKEGSTAADAVIAFAREHADVTPVTDVASAAEAHAHGVANVIGIEALGPQHIGHAVGETVDGIADLSDFAIPIPVVSAALVTIREIRRARGGDVPVEEVAANIGVHVAGRATAMAALAWLGSALAIPTAGIAPVALGITGALVGGRGAKALVDSGVVKSVIKAVKAPYVKEPITEAVIRRMCQHARTGFRDDLGLADEAFQRTEDFFRGAMRDGIQMSASDCGRELARLMKPVFQKRLERALERERIQGERRAAVVLAKLRAEIDRM